MSEAERRATAGPVAGFDEGRPGEAPSAPGGGRPSVDTNIKTTAGMKKCSNNGCYGLFFLEDFFIRRFFL